MDSTPKTCITCTNVPPELLQKLNAKKHFRKFGKIVRMLLRPKSKICVIQYETEESAEAAATAAGLYNGQSFTVEKVMKSPKRRIKKDLDPTWLPSSEVQAELEAMRAIGIGKNYNLRPEAMVVDQVTPSTPKRKEKKLKSNWKSPKTKISNAFDSNNSSRTGTLPAEQMELLNILKKPSFTTEEKYLVLDARDKLMRLRSKKLTDLTRVTYIIGTCMDMCPEKERLMRETKHQVAIYEQEKTGRDMNHSLAVKQYSRSSADQEVPLPHELRPVTVLQLTMGYLLHKIMDLGDNLETNLGEWYHFLWDRTRAIRKDITQQELCCQGSVQLVEQCARFHIHCSARLVAEDLSIFDQKINTENLTKCLQTLKYMYHDLKFKNEVCKNEAEFRAYIVLLNLNDGNFMWEVQQLKPEIQKSPELIFALNVYSALDKNNYVKFFKLVCSTTYLNACILLRYFIQVRIRALETILKSSSPRMPCAQFPLNELQNMLAFEGLSSTIDFFEYYGLVANENKTHIILDRKMFLSPALPYALDRATKTIESKRISSVGEVVCGEKLPPKDFENYVPHNSFNSDGYLNLAEAFPDLDDSVLQITMSTTKDSEVFSQQKSLPQIAKSNVNIFKTKQSLDSRSNSPLFGLDTTDRSTTIKPEMSKLLWTKVEPSNSTKPEPSTVFELQGKTDTKSIFGSTLPTFQNSIFGNTMIGSSPETNIFGGFTHTPVSIFGKFDQTPPKEISTTLSSLFGVGGLESNTMKSVETNKHSSSTGGFYYKIQIPQANQNISIKSSEAQITQNIVPIKKTSDEENLKLLELEQRLQNQKQERLEKLKQQEFEEQRKLLQMKKLEEEKENKRKEEERQKLLLEKIEEEKKKMEKLRIEKLEKERIEQEKIQQEEIRKRQEIKRMEEIAKKKELERLEQLRKEAEALKKQKAFEEEIRKNRLREISENIKKRKIRKIISMWRSNIASNKRKRKAMDHWPIWVNANTVENEANELHMNNQEETLKYKKRYRSGVAENIDIEETKSLERIDLFNLTYKILQRSYTDLAIRHQNDIFWKVNIYLSESNDGFNHVHESLNKLFEWEDQNESCHLIKQIKYSVNRITYCITKNEINNSKSTNGLVFVGNIFNEILLRRINNVIKSLGKNMSIPLVIILLGDCNYDNSNYITALKQQSPCISIIKVFHDRNLPDVMKEGLIFLAENIQKPPPLELDMLNSFLYKNLSCEIWESMMSFAKWNHPYKLCLTNPKIVFNLYNEAINRLTAIIFKEDNYECQEFSTLFNKFLCDNNFLPCDFKYFPFFWKERKYLQFVRNILEELKLPPFETKWPPQSKRDLERIIFDFCAKYFKQPEKKFYIIMGKILRDFDSILDFNKISSFQWTDVMKSFAIEKLKEIDFSLPAIYKTKTTFFNQLFVVYDINDLSEYRKDAWFYLNNPLIKKEIDISKQIYETENNRVVPIIEENIDLDKTLLHLTNYSILTEDKLENAKADLKHFKILMSDLEESMNIQKRISQRMEDTLKMVLDE